MNMAQICAKPLCVAIVHLYGWTQWKTLLTLFAFLFSHHFSRMSKVRLVKSPRKVIHFNINEKGSSVSYSVVSSHFRFQRNFQISAKTFHAHSQTIFHIVKTQRYHYKENFRFEYTVMECSNLMVLERNLKTDHLLFNDFPSSRFGVPMSLELSQKVVCVSQATSFFHKFCKFSELFEGNSIMSLYEYPTEHVARFKSKQKTTAKYSLDK